MKAHKKTAELEGMGGLDIAGNSLESEYSSPCEDGNLKRFFDGVPDNGGNFDTKTPNFSSPPRGNIEDLDAAVEANRTPRKALLKDAVAGRYLSPIDIALKFHGEAVAAAQSIGVDLPDDVQFTGAWVYTENPETQKKDSRQGYLAEIVTRPDGLTRPVYTFHSYREGGKSLQWNPDNLLWDEHNDESAIHQAYDPSAYKAKAAQLAKEHTAKREAREKQDATGRAVVAMTAAKLFESLQDCTGHDYLTHKGIGSHGAKIATAKLTGTLYNQADGKTFEGTVCEAGELIIPLYCAGEIVSLQRIKPNGGKQFLSGGSTSGAYYLLKGIEQGRAFVAEGFATAATVCEATGRDVYVAFSAHNLKAVTDAHLNIGAVAADGGKAGIAGADKTGLPFYAPPDLSNGDDWNDYAQTRTIAGVKMQLEGVEMVDRETKPEQSSIPNGWDLADKAKSPTYLVDGLIEEDAHGIFGGASMTYKTFWALRMAYSICSGQPFMGREVYKQGAVVYVCGEGQGAVARRLKALLIKLGKPKHAIHVITSGVSFKDPASMEALAKTIKPLNPVLVIFDTFASMAGGVNEDNNSEVGEALNLVRDTCRTAGASSLIVHHFGKDAEKGFRGASAFVNNVDYAFIAKRYGDKSFKASVECFKMKDGEHFQEVRFKTELVYLGLFDQKGKEVASLVAEHDGDGPEYKILTQDETMLKELNLLQSNAPITSTSEDPTWIKGKDWDAAAKLAGVKNCSRSRAGLIESGQVAKHGNKYRAIN